MDGRRLSLFLTVLFFSVAGRAAEASEPALALLACSPQITGGQPLSCEIGLIGTPTDDAEVSIALLGTDHRTAKPPANFTLRAGARRARFHIATEPVAAPTPVTILVSYRGQSISATRHIVPPDLEDLSFKQREVPAGATAKARVRLSGPAPATGMQVFLRSADPSAASVPDTFVIPPGAREAVFDVTSKSIKAAKNVMVFASLDADLANKRGSSLFISRTLKPDLALLGLSFLDGNDRRLAGPSQREGVRMCTDVANIGHERAPESYVRLILLANGNNIELLEEVERLKPGHRQNLCFRLPPLDVQLGYTLNLYVDYWNLIEETDEANNYQVLAHEPVRYDPLGPPASSPAKAAAPVKHSI